MKNTKHIVQYGIIVTANGITLVLMALWVKGLEIQSVAAAIGLSIVYTATEVLYWWFFINFFSSLPIWLYPLVTLFLSGGIFMGLGNLIPGVLISNVTASLWILCILTSLNAILGSIFSLNVETLFDQKITKKLVSRRSNPVFTDKPGFIYLEIDGLSENSFRRSMEKGFMPTLNSWLKHNTHEILGWETDFSSQTGSMQAGILMGNNDEIPAYRWWDRLHKHVVVSGSPRDAFQLEKQLSTGNGLLKGGGSSRGNVFSGDAAESMFTFGTLLDPSRHFGPGYYLYLLSPFVVVRLITRFFTELFKEWWQALLQRLRKDKYRVRSRNFLYAFLRAALGPVLQDLTTSIVINDILRGIPAIYATYPAYDDIAHFAGMETPEAMKILKEMDRLFARIERSLQYAPRPYHIIVLSDHGQSTGPTFEAAYGITLEKLVKGSIHGDSKIFASLDTHEAWDNVNAFLNESVHADTQVARFLKSMLLNQTKDGIVSIGPERTKKKSSREQIKMDESQLIVLASGCTGLINFTESQHRMTFEEIQKSYPELLVNLIRHPGIGFVMVRSEVSGSLILSKRGLYFLELDTYVGENPLAFYSPHAPALLKRESSYSNCPDIIVNSIYNPQTEELCSFENQVGHHGGLGGMQNFPFVCYPKTLPVDPEPMVGATSVYRLLKGWRELYQ